MSWNRDNSCTIIHRFTKPCRDLFNLFDQFVCISRIFFSRHNCFCGRALVLPYATRRQAHSQQLAQPAHFAQGAEFLPVLRSCSCRGAVRRLPVPFTWPHLKRGDWGGAPRAIVRRPRPPPEPAPPRPRRLRRPPAAPAKWQQTPAAPPPPRCQSTYG